MRRVGSIILFVAGGWMLCSEVLMAFFDMGEGGAAAAFAITFFLLLAAPFLLLGAWASPGARWRELGLTMLIAAGLGGVSALTMILMFADPTMKDILPPDVKQPHFALLPGFINLAVVAGLGLIQYRVGRRTLEA